MEGKVIWIIGCSYGIGQALAEKLDSLGAKLILSARDQTALTELNNRMGDRHMVLSLDISQDQQIKSCLEKIYSMFDHLDIVINMAAIYKSAEQKPYDFVFARKLIDINISSAISLAYHLIPKMLQYDKDCQFILCASVAGYIGLPQGQPYSCSKAALINFAESLHAELKSSNVNVRIINPGFVKTRLTDKNKFTMPFIIDSEKAANYITSSLNDNNFEIHFPKMFTRILKFIALLPYGLLLRITKKLNRG